MKSLIKDIISSLQEHSDSQRIKFAKTSCPTNMKVIGISSANLLKVLNELKSSIKYFPISEKIVLIKELCQTGIMECQHLAFRFIDTDRKIRQELKAEDVDDLLVNMDNWASVDSYAVIVVGYAWREEVISIDKIKSFLNSDDKWIRRIAIVATVPLNQKSRGGKVDIEQTIEICKLVIDDHEDCIVKALSWALRELSKRTPEPVIDFLEVYYDRLHKRIIREVTHKLEYGTKN